MTTPRWDVLTFGESMLRLTPEAGRRVEDAFSFAATVGGTESNLCVALARLGRATTWLSALPESPLGRRLAHELRAHGVGIEHVVWSDGRLGLYFLEPGAAPRPARVLYDRTDSAVALLDPALVDSGLVTAARLLHLTGITPALSTNCATICANLADAAQQADVPISLDVNYRAKLWSPAAAREGLHPLLEHTTLLFCGIGDARTIWDLTGTAAEVAAALLERSSAQLVVVTDGGAGATARTRDGQTAQQAALAVEAVDPVGAGDAFAAGVLHAWLDDPDDLQTMLRTGTALAALKMTLPGDHALITHEDLSDTLAALDSATGRPDIVR